MKINRHRLKNSYWKLSLFSFFSLAAGLHLMIDPENVSHFVVKGVGLIWFLEGIGYILDVAKIRLDNKIKEQKEQ